MHDGGTVCARAGCDGTGSHRLPETGRRSPRSGIDVDDVDLACGGIPQHIQLRTVYPHRFEQQ